MAKMSEQQGADAVPGAGRVQMSPVIKLEERVGGLGIRLNDRVCQKLQAIGWSMRSSDRFRLHSHQDLLALLAEVHHHQRSMASYCERWTCKTAETQPFKEPDNRLPLGPPQGPPLGPPTHSADFILETTNTPTQLFSHRGLTFLTSSDYVVSGRVIEGRWRWS